MSAGNAYAIGLDKNAANYTPLSPLSLLARSAYVYPHSISVIHGRQRFTWGEGYKRCRRLASALQKNGVGKDDTVAAMLPNIPAMYDAHFGVPMAGAVLNTLNTRLDAKAIAFMLDHGEAKVLITDREFSSTMQEALPLFHCNGWCFPWTMAANAGTNVCLRKVEAKAVFDLIREHAVTHYCGAPIVHNTLINAPSEWKKGIAHTVHCLVAGAAPPGAVIEGMQKMGFNLTHVYGLTETYGPAAVCSKHPEWDALPLAEQVRLNGRQGVWYHLQEGMTVMDPSAMEPVPRDSETMGEIMFRGNITMKGYLKNAQATQEAFAGGWFHSGDIVVMHADGYVKIKDRSKDVIISGGENISSIEVEDVLCSHPAVMMAAVVARPDPKWGESPCAFVELKPQTGPSKEEIIEFCRERMAHFKVPKTVIFGPLPKTSTGKIQKFVLREQAR